MFNLKEKESDSVKIATVGDCNTARQIADLDACFEVLSPEKKDFYDIVLSLDPGDKAHIGITLKGFSPTVITLEPDAYEECIASIVGMAKHKTLAPIDYADMAQIFNENTRFIFSTFAPTEFVATAAQKLKEKVPASDAVSLFYFYGKLELIDVWNAFDHIIKENFLTGDKIICADYFQREADCVKLSLFLKSNS